MYCIFTKPLLQAPERYNWILNLPCDCRDCLVTVKLAFQARDAAEAAEAARVMGAA